MSDEPRGLHLSLPATAENVTVVRHAVAGFAETLGMDEVGVADLKTVVTEACMNAAVHAYPDGPGPVEVEARGEGEELAVVVTDSGAGIKPRADLERPGLRLGLSLIAALSSGFEISGGLGRGTRVAMRIPLQAGDERRFEGPSGRVEAAAQTTLQVADPAVLGPVLARVVGALAARRDLTIDRLSDAMLLTDAISAGAPELSLDGHLRVDVTDAEDGIGLRVGPMEPGAGEKLRRGLEVPEVGGSLEKLADELEVQTNGDGEYLLLRFAIGGP